MQIDLYQGVLKPKVSNHLEGLVSRMALSLQTLREDGFPHSSALPPRLPPWGHALRRIRALHIVDGVSLLDKDATNHLIKGVIRSEAYLDASTQTFGCRRESRRAHTGC